jgi:hypothetical protein
MGSQKINYKLEKDSHGHSTATQPDIHRVPRQSGQGVKLITHHHLVLRLCVELYLYSLIRLHGMIC